MSKQGGIQDGEAPGVTTNTDDLAHRLSDNLNRPVQDKTGIAGAYAFALLTVDPENKDRLSAALRVVDQLGLTLERGSVQTLVIDHVEQPSRD
jgi:uncharacterized protein (TIGR03435 family)